MSSMIKTFDNPDESNTSFNNAGYCKSTEIPKELNDIELMS